MQNLKVKKYRNDIIINPKAKYTKEDLDKTLELLEKEMKPQDIVEHVNNLTARQIKFIRLIKSMGDERDMELLYECKYFISRIKNQIQIRKALAKAKAKAVQKMEVGQLDREKLKNTRKIFLVGEKEESTKNGKKPIIKKTKKQNI